MQIETGNEIKGVLIMKKTKLVFVVLSLLLCLLAFVGCNDNDDTKPKQPDTNDLIYLVDGEEYATIKSVSNEIQTLPADPSKTGFVFDGWYLDKDEWDEPFTANSILDIDITKDIYVYAKFNAIEYNITYELDSGSHSNVKTYTAENEVVLKDASKKGYSFVGWYKDSAFTEKVTSISAGTTGNITLYAKYEIVNYSITFENTKDADNENPTSYTINDETISLKSISCEGFIFEGWYKGDTRVTSIRNGSTGDVTLSARWSPEWNEISTLEELQNMSMTKKYRLMQDIDCGGMEWTPISSSFEGVLDGNGHTISNFIITGTKINAGLFVLNEGTIMNLKVTDFEINVTSEEQYYEVRAGAIVAENRGTIDNCYAKGSITVKTTGEYADANCGGIAGDNNKIITNCTAAVNINATTTSKYSSVNAGGLMGYGDYVTITVTNCHASGNITANSRDDGFVGGLIGIYQYGTVSSSSATGTVSLTSQEAVYAGGLVGQIKFLGVVSNCFATGDVSASARRYGEVGGLVGYNGWDNNSPSKCCVEYCYATGNVSLSSGSAADADANVGGLVGWNCYGTVKYSFATGEAVINSCGGDRSLGYVVGQNLGKTINCYALKTSLVGRTTVYYSNGTIMAQGTNTNCAVKELAELQTAEFCTTTLGWSSEIWNFEDGQYPTLKNVGYVE